MHVGTARETNKMMAMMFRRSEVVMQDDFSFLLAAAGGLGRVDFLRGVGIAVDLAAFHVLEPAVVGHIGHGDSLRWVGVQHGEEEASEGGRVDVFVEEADVGIVRLGDAGLGVLSVFAVPFRPAFYQIVV